MEEQDQEIIAGALGMFQKFGLRSVTMDDVARELGISKKTIYKYFENKADLVHQCVKSILEMVMSHISEIHSQTQNPIDELFQIDDVVGAIMANHNPGMKFQLAKYYPESFRYVEDGRSKLVSKMIFENIENGQKRGYYRTDFEPEIITFLYCHKIETVPEEENRLLSKHDMRKIMQESLVYHIRGIATTKGLTYLEEKLKAIKPTL